VTDALNNATEYTYDEVGNKLTQKDTLGRITQWEYDNYGRSIKRVLPLGQEESFTYDLVGNVLTHKDFNGNTISCAYDSGNRMTSRTYPNSVEEKFYYTATGKQDTIIDARGTTIYKYDNGDRLIQAISTNGLSISYGYDTMGNRTSLTVPSGASACTYDQLNRFKTVTDPNGGVTTYSYDKVGNRKSVTYPNGTMTEYFYNTLNRLTRLENRKSNGMLISSYFYTLGLSGNRVKVTENSGRAVDYAYDGTYKLTQETINDPDFGLKTISYTYDAVGNRLTKTDNGVITNYSYDTNDRLLAESSQLTAVSYQYDNNGNTISKTEGLNSTIYNFDYLNRLIQVNTGTSIVQYAYDTDGTRMQKVVDGVVTNYLVDKNRDYSQVLEERDSGGSLVVSYNYGDDLISQKRNGVVSYYHYDGQLSTRQLTDAAQNVTDGYTYDAFGVLINRFGATINDYLYTGEQYDANVGFYYLRARYMNPSNGRFLTMDTWPGSVFEPAGLHKYVYVSQNPINFNDPPGMFTLTETTIAMVIGGILGTANYLIGYFSKPQDKREFDLFDMIISTALGVLGGYLAPIKIFTWRSVIATSAINAFTSACRYVANWFVHGGESLNAYAFFISLTKGAISGLVKGTLFKLGFTATVGTTNKMAIGITRGIIGSVTSEIVEELFNGTKEYLKENVRPEVDKAVNIIIELIQGRRDWMFQFNK
jgi:RHS repeat-associated protein